MSAPEPTPVAADDRCGCSFEGSLHTHETYVVPGTVDPAEVLAAPDERVVGAAEARALPTGSAVLIWADPRGQRIERPWGAQIVAERGRLTGPPSMPDYISDGWTYRVLWTPEWRS